MTVDKCGLELDMSSRSSVGSANSNGKDEFVYVNGESNGKDVNVGESKGSFVNGIKPNGEIKAEMNGNHTCEVDHELVSSEDRVEKEAVVESNAGAETPFVGENSYNNCEGDDERVSSEDQVVEEEEGVESNAGGESDVSAFVGEGVVEESDCRPVSEGESNAVDGSVDCVDASPVDDDELRSVTGEGVNSDAQDVPKVEVEKEVDAQCVDSVGDDDDDKVRSLAGEGRSSDVQETPQVEVDAPCVDTVVGDDNERSVADEDSNTEAQQPPSQDEVDAATVDNEDGDDNNFDAQQSPQDVVENGEVVVETEAQEETGEKDEEDGFQGDEPERFGDEVKKVEVVEDSSEIVVAEPEVVDDVVTEVDAVEADVNQSVEVRSADEEQLDGDVEGLMGPESLASEPVDAEDERLRPEGETDVMVPSDCDQQDSQTVDEKVKESDSVETAVDAVVVEESQGLGSEDSDAAGCVQDPSDNGEITDEVASDVIAGAEEFPVSKDVSSDVDVAENQADLESGASPNQDKFEVKEPVSTSDAQSDETSVAGESTEALLTEMQSDTTDTPVAELEPEVGVDIKSELKVEVEESQDVQQNKEAEQTESVEVIDREVSSEDFNAQQTETVEDTSALSELASASGTAVEEDESSVGANVGDGGVVDSLVDESQTVPESADSSDTAGNSDRSEDSNTNAPVDTAADSDTTKELTAPSFVADDSASVSTADTNSEPKSESRANLLQYPVSSSELGTEVVDSTLASNLVFGSFGCSPSGWGDEDCPVSGPPKESTGSGTQSSNVVAATPKYKVVSSKDLFKRNAQVSETKVEGYLINMPKKGVVLNEQIEKSKVLLEEKTRERNAARADFYKAKNALISALNKAKLDERAARHLKLEKRCEMESIQSSIDLARAALRVEKINTEVHRMRKHMEHSTVDIKVEKKMLREIKQMENERDQICGNSRRQQELKQAFEQMVQNEEKLKVLRVEFKALRDSASVAEERVQVAQQKLQENHLLDELKKQLTSAQCIQEEAFQHVQKLYKMKDEDFLKSQNDIEVAEGLVYAGDMDKFEHHCVSQVDEIMERWNKNDEFRKEYVRCNEERRIRRKIQLDGRECNQDEKPLSIPTVHVDRVNASSKGNSAPSASTSERDFPIAAKNSVSESKKIVEEKRKTGPAKKNQNLAEVSGRIEIEEENEESKLTEEDIELARKAEQLRAEQEAEKAARLEEQRILEHKLRSQEGMKNKRKKNEEAEARAKIKAQKEALQREKIRAKRAQQKQKKKEKNKGINVEVNEAESVQPAESSSETVTEPEVTEKPVTVANRPQKVPLRSRQVKTITSIPPSIRSRSKRGFLRHWKWFILFIVIVVSGYWLCS